MTQQERIEHNFRLTLGDMHVQLIVAQARIAELEAQIAAQDPPAPVANGKYEEAVTRQ